MIYLDNSATSFPKPREVRERIQQAFQNFGANPGRGGHQMSMATSEEVFNCRKTIADFFGADGPENVVFQLNCTQALNLVIKGTLKNGDHVLVSDLEHNAVMRPLTTMAKYGITHTIVKTFVGDNDKTVDSFRSAMGANTKLIICTGASNVWGIRLPVGRISALAHQYGIEFCLDAAQTAGIVPINMQADGFDYICAAGHKGLYGPMGTGILIMRDVKKLDTIIEGGTGTNSSSMDQPDEQPERYESGTQNIPGIAGLHAGISFVKRRGVENIYVDELAKVQYVHRKLKKIPHVKLYTDLPIQPYFAPLISFNILNTESEQVGDYLAKNGIAVRCGLHCAPQAHKKMGTEKGTVRISPSVFTKQNELDIFVKKIQQIKY